MSLIEFNEEIHRANGAQIGDEEYDKWFLEICYNFIERYSVSTMINLVAFEKLVEYFDALVPPWISVDLEKLKIAIDCHAHESLRDKLNENYLMLIKTHAYTAEPI